MKNALQLLFLSFFILAVVSTARAEDSATHSLYKVTTYNLGTALDFQDFSPINSQKFKPLLITGTKADILDADQLKDPNLEASANKAATDG